MENIVAFAFVAIVFLAGPAAAQISAGYATYSNSAGGVCSSVSSSLPAVSMNAAQFANGAACGQCVQITGTGNGAGDTPVSTAPYLAVINNVCPQCNYGDLDLQGTGNGKYGIKWSFVGCPGSGRKLIEGPFQGDTKVYTVGEHESATQEAASNEATEDTEQIASTIKSETTEVIEPESTDTPADIMPADEAADHQETTDNIVINTESVIPEDTPVNTEEIEQSEGAQKVSRRLMMAWN